MSCPRQHGFTLIEVLVALAVVALALSSGMAASGALTRNAERQADALLAQLCADNALIQQRLSRQMPGTGEQDLACTQAGRDFNVAVNVQPTPNPAFRRIDVQVFNQGTPILRVTTVQGRY